MNMSCLRLTLITLLLVLVPVTGTALEVTMLESPATGASGLSRLSADDKGRVLLSWVTEEVDKSALYYSTFSEDRFSEPALIASGADWFVNWADFPFVVTTGKSMTAHWLQKSNEGTYNYDVVAVFKDPETNQWTEGRIIHTDGVAAEHGFVGMLPMPGNSTLISWLDGRNTTSHHGESAAGHHGSGGMTLRAGIFSADGKTQREWELDKLVCDCCQTSVAMTSEGPIVVYRDRTKAEIRDTYITRLVNGEWTAPVSVYNDNWEVAGCPVNGPSAAAQGDQVAVGWFSARDNQPVVNLSLSRDSGASFPDRVVVASGNTNGRISVAMLESGKVAISWLELEGKKAWVKLGVYSPSGELLASTTVAETLSSRRSGFPVIAAVGEDVLVTWTDAGSSKQVKVARVRL